MAQLVNYMVYMHSNDYAYFVEASEKKKKSAPSSSMIIFLRSPFSHAKCERFNSKYSFRNFFFARQLSNYANFFSPNHHWFQPNDTAHSFRHATLHLKQVILLTLKLQLILYISLFFGFDRNHLGRLLAVLNLFSIFQNCSFNRLSSNSWSNAIKLRQRSPSVHIQ